MLNREWFAIRLGSPRAQSSKYLVGPASRPGSVSWILYGGVAQPGRQPRPNIAAAGHSRKIVEFAQQLGVRKALHHAKCERGAADTAARQAQRREFERVGSPINLRARFSSSGQWCRLAEQPLAAEAHAAPGVPCRLPLSQPFRVPRGPFFDRIFGVLIDQLFNSVARLIGRFFGLFEGLELLF